MNSSSRRSQKNPTLHPVLERITGMRRKKGRVEGTSRFVGCHYFLIAGEVAACRQLEAHEHLIDMKVRINLPISFNCSLIEIAGMLFRIILAPTSHGSCRQHGMSNSSIWSTVWLRSTIGLIYRLSVIDNGPAVVSGSQRLTALMAVAAVTSINAKNFFIRMTSLPFFSQSEVWLRCAIVVNVARVKCEMLSSMALGSKLQYPAVVTIVGVKYEISDSVTVALRAPRGELGSLWWGIGLSQSEPFHIIGQGHLLSHRSAEAFPTNATQLARSSILCFAALLFSRRRRHLSPPHFPSSLLLLPDYVSSALSIQSDPQPQRSLSLICCTSSASISFRSFTRAFFQLLVTHCWSVW